MTTSSPQDNSWITSINIPDTITIDTSSIMSSSTASTFSFTNGAAQPYYTITSGTGISSVNITGTGSGYDTTWRMPEEWVNRFPEWSRVEAMCKQYPGLDIAFRNFKNTYNLVKDDYDNPNTKK